MGYSLRTREARDGKDSRTGDSLSDKVTRPGRVRKGVLASGTALKEKHSHRLSAPPQSRVQEEQRSPGLATLGLTSIRQASLPCLVSWD